MQHAIPEPESEDHKGEGSERRQFHVVVILGAGTGEVEE
jgi:hypothetical protein